MTMRTSFENVEFYPRARSLSLGTPYAYLRLEPWNDDSAGGYGSVLPRANGTACAQAIKKGAQLHIGHMEMFLCNPHLEDMWQHGDVAAIPGPSVTEIVKGIVNCSLHIGNLVGRLEPRVGIMRDRGVIDLIELIWGDMEDSPNAFNKQFFGPELWYWLTVATPGATDVDRAMMGHRALYTAACKALDLVGLDSRKFVAFGCADRPQHWNSQPALGIPVARSCIICTAPGPEATAALVGDLTGGSGPENCMVLLNTLVEPHENRERLRICRQYNVPDVDLFADKPTTGTEQQRYAAGLAAINAQAPVFDALLPVLAG